MINFVRSVDVCELSQEDIEEVDKYSEQYPCIFKYNGIADLLKESVKVIIEGQEYLVHKDVIKKLGKLLVTTR